jgi:hypothetical protein
MPVPCSTVVHRRRFSAPVRTVHQDRRGARRGKVMVVSRRTGDHPARADAVTGRGRAMPEPPLSPDRHRSPKRERVTLCSYQHGSRSPVPTRRAPETVTGDQPDWPRPTGTPTPKGRTASRVAPVARWGHRTAPERPPPTLTRPQQPQYAIFGPPHPPTTPKSDIANPHTTVRTTHTEHMFDPHPPRHRRSPPVAPAVGGWRKDRRRRARSHHAPARARVPPRAAHPCD